MPQLGQGGSMVTGTAGPSGTTSNTTHQLARCSKPIGTAALAEPEQSTITGLQALGLGTPVPAVRLLMAQSGCFRVVDRGAAMAAVEMERRLTGRSGGRIVAADYIVTPNVVFSNQNAGGMGAGALVGSLLGPVGIVVGALAGSIRMQEAQTMLFLTDARSGVQEAAVEGSAKVSDFAGAGGLGGFGSDIGGFGAVGGYGNTAEGKLVAAAFVDSHNKLVTQLGGLGSRPAARVDSPQRRLVREVQSALKERGLYSGATDGVAGRGTSAAVMAYQQENALTADGEVTEALLTHMRGR